MIGSASSGIDLTNDIIVYQMIETPLIHVGSRSIIYT